MRINEINGENNEMKSWRRQSAKCGWRSLAAYRRSAKIKLAKMAMAAAKAYINEIMARQLKIKCINEIICGGENNK